MTFERRRLELEQLNRLEWASMLEATTLVLLVGVAVPLKYVSDVALPVKIMGPVHGLAFLIYLWTAVQTLSGGGWRAAAALRIVLVAFIPFAGFANIPFLRRRAAAVASAPA